MELKTKNVNLFFDFITDTIDGLVELMNNGYKIKDKKTGLFSRHTTEDTDVIEFKSLLKLNKACTIDKLEPLYTAYNSNILYSDSFDEFINIIYEYILFRRIAEQIFYYTPKYTDDEKKKSNYIEHPIFVERHSNLLKVFNPKGYYTIIKFNKTEDVSIDSQSSFLDSYINTGSIGKTYTTFVNISIKNIDDSAPGSNFEFILGDSPEINKPEEEIMVTNALANLAQSMKKEFEFIFSYALDNYSSYVKNLIYDSIETGYYSMDPDMTYRNSYKSLTCVEDKRIIYLDKLLEDIINGRITICK